MYTSFAIPKPSDEQAFERCTVVLFRGVLNDPNVKMHGRRGQRQQGVDLYGKRDGNPENYVGVQCKLISGIRGLTKEIVNREYSYALTFKPRIREFFIVTTAPDDALLDEYARELEIEHKRATGEDLSIQVWGWDTMQREIQRYPQALKAFWPDYSPATEEISANVAKIALGNEVILDAITQGFLSLNARGDRIISVATFDTEKRDPLEKLLDAEIDSYRDKIRDGHPHEARDLLAALLDRLPSGVSGRLLFRVKANLGACYLEIGDEEAGNRLTFEACAHAPDEPKAKVNLAYAYLRAGDWMAARDISRDALQSDPSHVEMAGALVQALAFDTSVSSPLEVIPREIASSKEVRLAHHAFLQRRGLIRELFESGLTLKIDFPDDESVVQAAAEAVLSAILQDEEFRTSRLVPAERIKAVQTARFDLETLWRKATSGDKWVAERHLALFSNLIVATDLIGDFDAATKLIAEAHPSALADSDVNTRIAQLAFHAGESDLFREAVDRLPSGQARSHFLFYEALQTSDWKIIAKLNGEDSYTVPSVDEELATAAANMAALFDDGSTPPAEAILSAAPETPGDPRVPFVAYDALRNCGYNEEAEKLFERLYESALRSELYSPRILLSHRAGRIGRWRVIPPLLDGYVDRNHNSPELRLLATAFTNIAPPSREAGRFFSALPPEIRNLAYYAEREANLHFNSGDLPKAERWYRTAIAQTTSAELSLFLPLVNILLRRIDNNGAQEVVQGLIGREVKGSPRNKATLAHLFMKYGYVAEALELAYKTLAAHPENAEIHGAYCTMILLGIREETGKGPTIPVPTSVADDCWVSLRSESGEVFAFVVCATPTDEPVHLIGHVYEASVHTLAKACFGKCVGETVEQQRPFELGTITWRIEEIKHKYLHVLHMIMSKFSSMFPDSSIMGRVESVENDTEIVLESVKKFCQYQESSVESYLKECVPIRILASLRGATSIDYAHYLQRLGHSVRASKGIEEERRRASALIAETRSNGAVVDAYAAWVLSTIGALDVAQSVFGNLFIAQSCVDEILSLREKIEARTVGTLSIAWHNGEFYRDEVTVDQRKQQIDLIDRIISDVTRICKVQPIEGPESLSRVSEVLVSQVAAHLMDPAFCASDGRLLISEDMYFRQLAAQECNVEGVWIQSVVMFSTDLGLLSFDQYCKILVKLSGYAHEHLAVSSAVLARVAAQDHSADMIEFRALARLIGSKDADRASHLSVAQEAILAFWLHEPADRAARLTGVILECLLRYRESDWHYFVAVLLSVLPHEPKSYLLKWLFGHFYPFSEIKAALNEIHRRRSLRFRPAHPRALIASRYGTR